MAAHPVSVVDERTWWDDHAEPIYVWGEPGRQAWHDGTVDCLVELLRLTGPLDGRRVLEIGCGLGRLTLPLAAMFPSAHVFGVDVSWRMLEQARRDRDVGYVLNLHYAEGDGRSIPRQWNGYTMPTFDVAYCVLVLQHIPADAVRAYLADVARFLEPGGRFVCQYVHGPGSESFLSHSYSIDEIQAWGEHAGLAYVSSDVGRVDPSWVWTCMERAA